MTKDQQIKDLQDRLDMAVDVLNSWKELYSELSTKHQALKGK